MLWCPGAKELSVPGHWQLLAKTIWLGNLKPCKIRIKQSLWSYMILQLLLQSSFKVSRGRLLSAYAKQGSRLDSLCIVHGIHSLLLSPMAKTAKTRKKNQGNRVKHRAIEEDWWWICFDFDPGFGTFGTGELHGLTALAALALRPQRPTHLSAPPWWVAGFVPGF